MIPLGATSKEFQPVCADSFYNRRGVCFVDGLGRWLLITYVLLSYQAASFAWQDQITEVYSDALLTHHELYGWFRKLTRGDKVIGVEVGKLALMEFNNEDTILFF